MSLQIIDKCLFIVETIEKWISA